MGAVICICNKIIHWFAFQAMNKYEVKLFRSSFKEFDLFIPATHVMVTDPREFIARIKTKHSPSIQWTGCFCISTFKKICWGKRKQGKST